MNVPEKTATEITEKRYDRVAPVYDLMEGLVERASFNRWRRLLWSKVAGTSILEIGVGTGKNFPFYPEDAQITAIDLSEKMLGLARQRGEKQGRKVCILRMDVQNLDFEADSFDTVVSSFVFCSVPDPIRGLEEVRRVVRVGGKVLLLEHVLSANRVLAWFMNRLNPVVVRIVGANINRRTVANVNLGGLKVERVTDLAAGIFKLIEARKE